MFDVMVSRGRKRVGHEVPGVVVWPLLFYCKMLGDISFDNVTLQSEGK